MGVMLNRRRYAGGKEGDYIDWLKSLGCIVYLPLGSDGDLQDRISGLSLTLTGNGSLTWDSNAEMYIVTNPSVESQYVAFLDNGMNKQTFANDTLTTIATVERVSANGYIGCYISPLSTSKTTKMSIVPLVNGTGNLGSWGSGIYNIAKTLQNSTQTIYQNGELLSSSELTGEYIPSNWNLSGNGFCVGMLRGGSNYARRQIFVKDIYVFNKVLTLAQIRKIQGYE